MLYSEEPTKSRTVVKLRYVHYILPFLREGFRPATHRVIRVQKRRVRDATYKDTGYASLRVGASRFAPLTPPLLPLDRLRAIQKKISP